MENKRQDGLECLASLHDSNFPAVAQIKIYWTDTVEMGKKEKKRHSGKECFAAKLPFEGTFGNFFRVPRFCTGY